MFGSAQPSFEAAFEVASIRPNRSGDAPSAVYFQAGRLIANNASARALIAYAYHLKDFQISGGPSWMASERYNLIAKQEDSATESMQKLPWFEYREQVGRMVQSLLAESFKLSVIQQQKQLPIYVLVPAKGGPKLSRSALDTYAADIRGRQGQLTAKGLSMEQWADILSWMPEVNERKVVDRTGIEGTFDISVQWAFDRNPSSRVDAGLPATGAAPDNAATVNPPGPSIFSALQEQLGLKLEPARGPVEFLVIGHVERPSEN
jgi:uncharacterized protein (TIGR03435 family)